MLRRLLVLVVAAAAVGVSACESSTTHDVAGTTTVPAPAFKANTSWDHAVLSADGKSLTISVSGAPLGDGPCEERLQHYVSETDHSVTVGFRRLVNPPHKQPVACPQVLVQTPVKIALRAQLGDRLLYDGVSLQPKPVWRVADVVKPTVLPGGVTVGSLNRMPGGSPSDWSLSAQVSSGPGWDLFIDQARAGSFVAPTTAPGKVVATTKIHGNDAKVYEYFNFTGHEIHWTERGFDITVRAELHTSNMHAPQSFANPEVAFIDPLLVRIADGIVVPPTA